MPFDFAKDFYQPMEAVLEENNAKMNSFAEIDKNTLVQACLAAKRALTAELEVNLTTYVKQWLEQENSRWWRKLFKSFLPQPQNSKELLNYFDKYLETLSLHSYLEHSSYNSLKSTHEIRLKKINRFLILEAFEDSITLKLSSEDFWILSFYPHEKHPYREQ